MQYVVVYVVCFAGEVWLYYCIVRVQNITYSMYVSSLVIVLEKVVD